MAARQVRRSVVISNLRVGLLAMDSDRLPLRKRKDILHGAARAAPLRQSVEQPCPPTLAYAAWAKARSSSVAVVCSRLCSVRSSYADMLWYASQLSHTFS